MKITGTLTLKEMPTLDIGGQDFGHLSQNRMCVCCCFDYLRNDCMLR